MAGRQVAGRCLASVTMSLMTRALLVGCALFVGWLAACDGQQDDSQDTTLPGTTGTSSSVGGQGGGGGAGAGGGLPADALQWEPWVVASFEASEPHAWSDFPVRVELEHEQGTSLTVDGYWTGGSSWAVRFAAPLLGEWSWTSSSETGDPGLVASGNFRIAAPTEAQVLANSNLRGHVRVAGRHFVHGDGTPYLPQADTFWYFNASFTRNMFGEDTSNPLGSLTEGFYDWLADRTTKGFNAVLVRWVSGHSSSGDAANEGGYLWDSVATPPDAPTADWSELNPGYFEPLDTRVQALWERGIVIFGHPTWIGEEEGLTVDQAAALSHYLLARYGAYNLVWSITGEFHVALPYWEADDYASFVELARTVGGSDDVEPPQEGFNSFGHPMSIHPGGSDPNWPEPFGQSSLRFEGEDWLDHHWIQTYSHTDKIAYRVAELRNDLPTGPGAERPVLLAEPCYEHAEESSCDYRGRDQGATLAEQEAATQRRQAWTALVSGASGYGYGADGLWQGTRPEALELLGSAQVRHARELFETLAWPALTPSSCVESFDGAAWWPTPIEYPTSDVEAWVYAPRCTMIEGAAYVIYVPGGSEGASLRAVQLAGGAYYARWLDPRSGTASDVVSGPAFNADGNDEEPLPARPSSAPNDDWALVLTVSAP